MELVVLTGAGISAESGLGTFRDAGGIWTKVDLNEVATPQGFARTFELNLAPTGGEFDEVIGGPASETVPAWAGRIGL